MIQSRGGRLSPTLRQSMRISIIEGSLYAIAVGFGELYFVADAVRTGASPWLAGLVATLPLWLGATGPILVLWLLSRGTSRRRIAATAVAAQALVLVTLSWTATSPNHDPTAILLAAVAYQLCGQAAGTAWSSWYGDLVPALVRGRYFALRNRFVHLFTCLGLAVAGALLQVTEPGVMPDLSSSTAGRGFQIIFAIAFLARSGSALLLAKSPEPAAATFAPVRTAVQFLRQPHATRIWRILAIAGSLQFTVYIASPFFAPYMLKGIELSYFEYTLASLSAVTLKFISLPTWGKTVDRYGARPVYAAACLLIAIIPIPWLIVRGPTGAIAAQALSGFSWGAHELGQFSLLLESAPAPRRPHVFAALNVVSGTGQLLGTVVGAAIMWSTDNNYRAVFACSIVARFIVAGVLPRVIPHDPSRPTLAYRQILFRLLGGGPSGGLSHRPMFVSAGRTEPESGPDSTARSDLLDVDGPHVKS